ncbi:MAG: YheU family protein [Porticoccaceae bacterium]
MEIPPQRLSGELLDAIIEAFVLREGTDYGERESSLADKIAQVRARIASGEVVVVFDETTESCNLLLRDEFRKFSQVHD